MRSAYLLEQMNYKIKLAATKYCVARSVLLSIRSPGDWEMELRVLQDEDICSPMVAAFTIEDPNDAIGPDGYMKSKKQCMAIKKRLEEGCQLILWIWLGAIGDGKNYSLNDSEWHYLFAFTCS